MELKKDDNNCYVLCDEEKRNIANEIILRLLKSKFKTVLYLDHSAHDGSFGKLLEEISNDLLIIKSVSIDVNRKDEKVIAGNFSMLQEKKILYF